MSKIEIRPVRSKKDLKEFIFLPEKIHSGNKNWLPPLYSDEFILFNPRKNKSFEYCDHILLLAYREGKAVGRIMGLINQRYNELKNERNARFCFLDSINDSQVSKTLLGKVEEWAAERKMEKVVGPLGFSDKDPQGIQIEGFEYPSVLAAPNNASYLPGLVEMEGYIKRVDLVDYLADVPSEIPEVYKRVLSRVEIRPDYRIVEFRKKKELKPYIIDILELMNETYSNIYGFVPLTDNEKEDLAKRYMPILDPRFIKVFFIEDTLAGFVIAMPDIAKGLMKARGRLFPFGFIHILRSVRKTTNLLMLLGAVKEEYRGKGIDAIMGAKILESATRSRMKTLDSHLILEHNTRMRAEYERIGGKVVKKYRIYQKDIPVSDK